MIVSGPLAGDAVSQSLPSQSGDETTSVDSLNFQTCMAFLAATIPSDSQPVCWELDWLVAMMCKSLSRERLVELVNREGRCPPDGPWKPRPVLAHGYAFDWLPAHFFSLRTPSGRNIRISDPHRFWGRELAEAAFAEGLYVAPPFSLETQTVMLEITMTRFRERCIEYGAVPRQWEGPGQGASKFMNDWGIKDYLSGSYVQ